MLSNAGWAFSSYLLKNIVNSIATCSDPANVFSLVYPSIVGFSVSLLIYDFGMRIHLIACAKTVPKLTGRIIKRLFEYDMCHPKKDYHNSSSGATGVHILEIAKGSELILKLIINDFLPVWLNLGVAIVLLINAQPFLGLIFSCWIVVHYTVTFFRVRKLMFQSKTCANDYSNMSSVLMDVLSNSQIVRMFGNNNHERNYLGNFEEKLRNSTQKVRTEYQKVSILLGFMTTAMVTSLVILSIHFWSINVINIGGFILVSSLIFICVDKVWKSGSLVWELFNEIGRCRQMLSFILLDDESIESAEKDTPLVVSKGEIKFKNASFSYVGNLPIIKNLDITIKSGE